MPRSRRLNGTVVVAFLGTVLCAAAAKGAPGQNLWNEYGLVQTNDGRLGRLTYTSYRFKDLTGALAAWEWQRSPQGKACDQAPYCTLDQGKITVFDNNYVVVMNHNVRKADVDAILKSLPNKTDTALPAILTFLPRQGLVPDSARYLLGNESMNAFAPELAFADPGFTQGGEAQVAQYRVDNGAPVRLAIFYYPTPEMARQHSVTFRMHSGVHVKRSGVLDAVVFGNATEQQADTLLSRVQYEAKITWNDTPPPPPIKPLYRLLVNIIYGSIGVSLLGLTAGLFYAGTRIYRRRYGNLESEEAMTTLRIT